MRTRRTAIGKAVAVLSIITLVLATALGVVLVAPQSPSRTTATSAFLIFHQQGDPCGFMHLPWGVTITNETGNETEVQPPGSLKEIQTMLQGETAGSGYDANQSTIAFLLSNGVYNYTMIPPGVGGKNGTGTVTVDGADVAVQFPSNFCPP
jgi:hypothetical protein